MNTKRIGDLQTVENKNKHRAAAAKYSHLRVQLEDGREISLLFTDKEIFRAQNRALKNPEDLPKVCKFRDLFD